MSESSCCNLIDTAYFCDYRLAVWYSTYHCLRRSAAHLMPHMILRHYGSGWYGFIQSQHIHMDVIARSSGEWKLIWYCGYRILQITQHLKNLQRWFKFSDSFSYRVPMVSLLSPVRSETENIVKEDPNHKTIGYGVLIFVIHIISSKKSVSFDSLSCLKEWKLGRKH